MAPRRLLLPLLSALLLSACAAVGPAPDDVYYRLPSTTPEPASPKLAGVVLIEAPRAGDLHGDAPMLYSDDAAGLGLLQYHYRHWADRPTALVADFMQAWLSTRGVADTVLNDDGNADGDWRLVGKLKRFEQLNGMQPPAVVVGLELHLIEMAHRAAPPRGGYYEARAEIASADPLDAVEGYRQALAQVLDAFTGSLQ